MDIMLRNAPEGTIAVKVNGMVVDVLTPFVCTNDLVSWRNRTGLAFPTLGHAEMFTYEQIMMGF